ncbi:MAG: VOC family protein [Gemmatimonadaceae bacterium]
MHPQLVSLTSEFQQAQERLDRLAVRLPHEQWSRRPAPERWSVGECVAHLNLTARAFLPLLDVALEQARALGGAAPRRYRHDPLGWLLWLSSGPPARGIPCIGLNGGPEFKHNEAFSFQVATVDQAETDRYWNAIVDNVGEESQCGWCKDKWGVALQITPIALTQAVTSEDRAAAKRAFDAMMTMKKIDITTIEAAKLVRSRSAGSDNALN